jgi:hypothetical protein
VIFGITIVSTLSKSSSVKTGKRKIRIKNENIVRRNGNRTDSSGIFSIFFPVFSFPQFFKIFHPPPSVPTPAAQSDSVNLLGGTFHFFQFQLQDESPGIEIHS